jgi:hypothetical protein
LYFRQASFSPKQNIVAVENRDLKTQRTTGFSKDLTVNDTETGFKISVFNCNNVLFGTKTGLSKIQKVNNVYTLNITTNNYKNSLKITTG